MRRDEKITWGALSAAMAIILGLVLMMTFSKGQAMTISEPFDDVQVSNQTCSGTNDDANMPGSGHELLNETIAHNCTVTLHNATWPGQTLTLNVCENGTGSFSITLGVDGQTTLKGPTVPFTTTANKCTVVGIAYTSLGVAQITGYILNE